MRQTDHLRSAALAEVAFEFATEVLKENGAMVVKLLQGAEEAAYVAMLRKRFAKVDGSNRPRAVIVLQKCTLWPADSGLKRADRAEFRLLRLACTMRCVYCAQIQ